MIINKIEISNFKGIHKLKIEDCKNLLIYGDNGAGKSSIFEAIRHTLFWQKIKKEKTSVASTPEDEQALLSTYRNTLQNKASTDPLYIKINDQKYDQFNFVVDTSVFLINIEDILHVKYPLRLDQFDFLTDIDSTSIDTIKIEVHNFLNFCREDITIEFEEIAGTYQVKASEGVINTTELSSYFNEAKINLIVLAIIFAKIKLDSKKNKLIVLDDFITSLDVSNRSFIMRYMLEKLYTENYQFIILTHNIYFFNLISYLINESSTHKNKWDVYTIYRQNNESKIYQKDDRSLTAEIIKNNSQNTSQQNDIRKLFERYIHEIAIHLHLQTLDDKDYILQQILKGKSVFKISEEYQTLHDMIDSILNEPEIKENTKNKYEQYKITNFSVIQDSLATLKLYQKTMMHPGSHHRSNSSTPTGKEIDHSLEILTLLEKRLRQLNDEKKHYVDGA